MEYQVTLLATGIPGDFIATISTGSGTLVIKRSTPEVVAGSTPTYGFKRERQSTTAEELTAFLERQKGQGAT